MKLIVGLGNPGPAYEGTPHNMGFDALDECARRFGARFHNADPINGLLARAKVGGEEIFLLKPRTFMNLSGEAVAAFATKMRIAPEDILVLVDDADLPMGAMRWRPKGGDGGHKGLRSISNELVSQDYARLRIGICPEGERPEDLETYVLTPFSPKERKWAQEIARRASESTELAIRRGVEFAANRYNGVKIEAPEAREATRS